MGNICSFLRNKHLSFWLAITLAAAMPPLSAHGDWWLRASAPFRGVTIRGVTQDDPSSRFIQERIIPKFSKKTGIRVEMELVPWDIMYDKSIRDMAGGTGYYDFVYVEQDIIYAYLAQGYLAGLSSLLGDNPGLKSPEFSPEAFTSFIDYFRDPESGELYGVPMQSFLKTYVYRRDLFENPENRAKYLKRYGRPLSPAKSMDHYREIAEFFTLHYKGGGTKIWGTTVQATTDGSASFYEFFETIAPSFGILNWGINLKTHKASVKRGGSMNSPAAKKALGFWVGLLDLAPPESITSDWSDVARTFAGGRAAQGWVYGEHIAWLTQDRSRSKVMDLVGVALPPLARGVKPGSGESLGYIGYYDGASFSIPQSSAKKDAAILLLQYLTEPEFQEEWAIKSFGVILEKTLDSPKLTSSSRVTSEYFKMMKESGHLFSGGPPFPFHAAARDLITPYIHQAIKKEISPGRALDLAAETLDRKLPEIMQQRAWK